MKRIITCSDGTWNSPGIKDRGKEVTNNVQLLFKSILSEDASNSKIKQVKLYATGLGSNKHDIKDKIFGGIEGKGIDKRIKDLYTFLILNYEIGDELYFFGFSRGAYTARSLGGLVRNCGILKPEHIHLVDKAYELYRDRNDYTNPDSDLMISFRNSYAWENITPIKCIGVWDTVGSLGLPFTKKANLEKYKFHDVKLSKYVEYAFHAIAIDEKRSSFIPTLWELEPNISIENVEQRWFVGVHCNIGGGYIDTGLSDLALQWMIERVKAIGLNIGEIVKPEKVEYQFKPNYRGELRNSLSWYYRVLPITKRTYQAANIRKDKNGNPIQTNETFDTSVYDRIEDPSQKYKIKVLKKEE